MISRIVSRAENFGLVIALAIMALLPLAEIALRAAFQVGVSGAAAFTQNFGLVAGMLGAVIAAREGRLLSLSTLPALLGIGVGARPPVHRSLSPPSPRCSLSPAVDFVAAERDGGNIIAYGVPVWLMASALPPASP